MTGYGRWAGAAGLLMAASAQAQVALPRNADAAPVRGGAVAARPTRHSLTLNGVFRAASGRTIGPAWVDGPYRAVEAPRGTPVDGLTITGLKATNLARDGIRLCLARGVLIERFDLAHADTPSSGRDLPEGIALGSNGCGAAGSDVVIRHGRVAGFRSVAKEGRYTNGDGIAIEGGYDRVLIEDVQARDNSDACFDLKATNLTLRDLAASGCNRAYRIWSPSAEATTLSAHDFGGAAIWLGRGASLHVRHFVASGGTARSILFRWESGATLVIDTCDLSRVAPGAMLTKSDGRAGLIRLGPGCRIPPVR